jgi:hypothetical protein
MPKISKVGKFRQTAAVAAAESSPATKGGDNAENDKQLSRGQRKRQAKKDQYQRRQKLVLSSLQLQHEEDQKKRIDGLDALKEALLQSTAATDGDNPAAPVATETPVHSMLKTNKNKKELTAREVTHLGLVLEHPSFQSNPFATIKEHLKNTLALSAQGVRAQSALRDKQVAAKDEEKKRIKKEKLQERGGKQRKKFRGARMSRS